MLDRKDLHVHWVTHSICRGLIRRLKKWNTKILKEKLGSCWSNYMKIWERWQLRNKHLFVSLIMGFLLRVQGKCLSTVEKIKRTREPSELSFMKCFRVLLVFILAPFSPWDIFVSDTQGLKWTIFIDLEGQHITGSSTYST